MVTLLTLCALRTVSADEPARFTAGLEPIR
jgi:hypothetical protein